MAYIEQYERTKRWYERFRALNSGRPHEVPSDNYVDEIYAFFMNCYHIKDWIKADLSVSAAIRETVEGHINSSQPLRLCADVCNSLKHFRLTRPRSDENPAFGRKRFALSLGVGQPTTIGLKYEVTTNTGPVDAFQLATDCIAAWDAFFSANGLT